MRSRFLCGPVLVLLLAGAACADPGPGSGGADTAIDQSSAGAGGTGSDVAVCLEGDEFVADGPVPVAPPAGGDARAVADLRWQRHDGCERFVIDLADEDSATASVPGVVNVDVLRDLGVVRIELREVEWADPDATEAMFDGPLTRAAYSVRAPEGRWIFVDLHLAEAAEARVIVLEDPARVVVDLRPGGAPLGPSAVTGERVVILEPRPGEASYPLTLTGYARTFEANVVARLERGGTDLHETFTTATAWADAWGYYAMTIPEGPAGEVSLHVGEHSARDGTWQGVAVELEMR